MLLNSRNLILFIIVGIIGIFFFFKIQKSHYYDEYNSIKKSILSNKNVRIIELGGNKDLSYEEIYAKIEIFPKGIFTIAGLSSDVNNFPKEVSIIEVDSSKLCYYSIKGEVDFLAFDIGTEGILGEAFNFKVKNVNDVINNYDKLKTIVDSIPIFPKFRIIKTKNNKWNGYLSRIKHGNKTIENSYGFIFPKIDSITKSIFKNHSPNIISTKN